MNLANCSKLPTKAESRTWFRAIQPHFWITALQTSQTRSFPTRYNAGSLSQPQFEVLYLAEDQIVALFEVQALLGSPIPGSYFPHPRMAWTIINVTVNLHYVADLTGYISSSQTAMECIEITAQELTGDWRGYQQRNSRTSVSQPVGIAPTQSLGAALYGIPDLEGFLTISAKVPTSLVLAIFPENLHRRSWVEFYYPATRERHRLTAL